MIKVTIELVSSLSGKTKKLSEITISNDGTGTEQQGNYDIQLIKFGARPDYKMKMFSFPRKRLNELDLTLQALVKLVGYRNGL